MTLYRARKIFHIHIVAAFKNVSIYEYKSNKQINNIFKNHYALLTSVRVLKGHICNNKMNKFLTNVFCILSTLDISEMNKSHLVGQLLNSIHDSRTHVYKIHW